MFTGLNINRGEWRALADVHEAKMKAIEDEKKRLEGGDTQGEQRGSKLRAALLPDTQCDLLLLCCSARRRKVQDLCYLINLQDC